MATALTRRLGAFTDLKDEQRARLDFLCRDVRTLRAKTDIISDGDRPETIHLVVVDGWATRYKCLPDGSRQIFAFLVPGDFVDLYATILGRMDHGVRALTRCSVAYIPPDRFDALTSQDAQLERAFWWSKLVEEAILRSWMVSLGQRDAYGRVAHLLCRLYARMDLVGLMEDDHLDFPITQDQIGDATGVTAVHVNRTLQRLRNDKLIELGGKVLRVLDLSKLRKIAGFDPAFLHIERLNQPDATRHLFPAGLRD